MESVRITGATNLIVSSSAGDRGIKGSTQRHYTGDFDNHETSRSASLLSSCFSCSRPTFEGFPASPRNSHRPNERRTRRHGNAFLSCSTHPDFPTTPISPPFLPLYLRCSLSFCELATPSSCREAVYNRHRGRRQWWIQSREGQGSDLGRCWTSHPF